MYQGDTARRRVLLLVVALRAMALAGALRVRLTYSASSPSRFSSMYS